jgi:hypothetical protein
MVIDDLGKILVNEQDKNLHDSSILYGKKLKESLRHHSDYAYIDM